MSTRIYFDFKTITNLAGKITCDLGITEKTDKEDLIRFMRLLNGPSFELSDFEIEVIKFLKNLIDDLNLQEPKTPEGEWLEKLFLKDDQYDWSSFKYRRVGRTLEIKIAEEEIIIVESEGDIEKIILFERPLLRQLAIDQLSDYYGYQEKIDLVYKYAKSYLDLVKISVDQDQDYNNQIYWSEMTEIWSWDELFDILEELRCYNTPNGVRLEIIDNRFLLLSNRFDDQEFIIDLGNCGLSGHRNLNLFYDMVAELHRFDFNVAAS